jgi:hypothetical protein
VIPSLFAALRTVRRRAVQFSEHPLGYPRMSRRSRMLAVRGEARRTLRASAGHVPECLRNRSAAAARSETPSFRTIATIWTLIATVDSISRLAISLVD